MYVAEHVGNCGITTYLTNAQVVHFVASQPLGPWRRKEVAVPALSSQWPSGSCPSAAVTPNGTVVMWIYRGGGRPKMGQDAWGNSCEAGASPCGFAKHGCGPNAPPPPPMKPRHEEMSGVDQGGSSNMLLAVSHSGPGGPFKPRVVQFEEKVSYSIAAPWILPNGTAFWVLQAPCSKTVCPNISSPDGVAECGGTCGTIIRGETWEGPYAVVARGACSRGEDHSIYVDQKGHFHCVSHRFSNATFPAGPFDATKDGGHSFSVDGRDPWYCADGKGGVEYCNLDSPIAYNATIIYEESGVNRFGTRERPHMLVEDGVPKALVTSVQHCQAPSIPDACTASDPQSCNISNHLCHNNWPGYMDRAWTSVAPLRTTKTTDKPSRSAVVP